MDKTLNDIKLFMNLFPEALYLLDRNVRIIWKNRVAVKNQINFSDNEILKKIRASISDDLSKKAKNIHVPFGNGMKSAYITQFQSMFVLLVFLENPHEAATKREMHNSELHMAEQKSFDSVFCKSSAYQDVIDIAHKASQVDANILISGETGVGKTFLSKQIHNLSSRKNGPFLAINCGAIPPSLLESELFGYEKGAFTGASSKGKIGLLESGKNGSILLDEIGELPLDMQVKLLHVLEEKKITRVGGTKIIELDFRLISATNKDLRAMISDGDFREDLYYRLDIISVKIPALRQRPEDIESLLVYFLHKHCKKYNIHKIISENAIDHLVQHDWPGNIRELQNVIERLVIMSEGGIIRSNDLPSHFLLEKNHNLNLNPTTRSQLKKGNEVMEKQMFLRVIKENSSIRKAAEKLEISHTTLLRKMKKYGISVPNKKIGK